MIGFEPSDLVGRDYNEKGNNTTHEKKGEKVSWCHENIQKY